MTKITVSGGFHNAPEITLRAKTVDDHIVLSDHQARRLNNHMCPVPRCICGMRGWLVSGVTQDALRDALNEAYYAAHERSNW